MNEIDEATRKRIIEQQRRAMNDMHRGHLGIVGNTVTNVYDAIAWLFTRPWTPVAFFLVVGFVVGHFAMQWAFDAGIEYGRNSCGVTTLYKNK